mgnify:CR=1 FL=1
MSSGKEDSLRSLGQGSTEYTFDYPNAQLLERFVNPALDGEGKMRKRGHWGNAVVITTDEFTSLCPVTGQPDWARIVIIYHPQEWCVESKSLKLYLAGYRNHGEFHEACVQRILDDLVVSLKPLWMVVQGRFTPRGGIPFWPLAVYSDRNRIATTNELLLRSLERMLSPGGRL